MVALRLFFQEKVNPIRTVILILTLFFSSLRCVQSIPIAEKKCMRKAIVGNYEVLLDITPQKKGEGLRPYLSKDEVALDYLNSYQEKQKITWPSIALGTVGSALLISGLGRSKKLFEGGELTKEKIYFLSGLSILLLNILTLKTINLANEGLLLRSVEEYNKRNFPLIFLAPYQGGQQGDVGMAAGLMKEF